MKIVIYRPHTNIGWFKRSIYSVIKGVPYPSKYEPMIDYLIRSKHELYFSTGLYRESGLTGLLKYIVDPVKLIVWCLLNNISLNRVKLLFSKRSVNDKDILFLMYYENCTYEIDDVARKKSVVGKALSKLSIYKIVHMTHYVYNVAIGVNNLKILKPNLLVAENNLANNSVFYMKKFGSIKADFVLLPYTPAPRFRKQAKFRVRIPKLVVTGTITYKMTDSDFLNYFEQDELQPLRRAIYEQASVYQDEVLCLVSDLNKYRDATSKTRKSFISSLIMHFKKAPVQSRYYKKDIVSIYNEHMMFAVPEEICDLPAIGFVEGIACGSVYFGLDSSMYRDIGLIPGTHYVAYDGTVQGLIAKVRYYQANITELERIAENGYEFVLRELAPNKVYKDFFTSLESKVAN